MSEIDRIKQYKFISNLSRLPFVDDILLFGSRARTDYRQDSDIDLAVVSPRASEADWNKIEEIISNADTLHEIDCVRYDAVQDKKFLDNINRDKQSIYLGE